MPTEPTFDIDRYRSALVTSSLLADHPSIRVGITGRIPEREPAQGNAGYSAPRDPDAAWIERQRWATAAGIDPRALTSAYQVHGNSVVNVNVDLRGIGGAPGSGSIGKADGLITASPGVAVMTLHADCMPIILVDPEAPAVGVIHAGWRGTVADVAGATVRAMASAYGSRPERLIALLGPGIRACCYEVGDEVVEAWRGIGADVADQALEMGARKWHFDIARANSLLLERAGVLPSHIEDRALCTQCNGDRWFSHRGQGPATGRFAAIAAIAPDDRKDSTTWF